MSSSVCTRMDGVKLRAAGCDAADLHKLAFSLEEIRAAGFTWGCGHSDVTTTTTARHRGVKAATLKDAGCNLGDLRKLGYSPAEIREAGFSLALMAADLRLGLLVEAGFSIDDFASSPSTASLFSYEALKQYFPEDTLQAHHFRPPPPPPPAVPPRGKESRTAIVAEQVEGIRSLRAADAAPLVIGDKSRDGLCVTFKRLPPAEAAALAATKCLPVTTNRSYDYDGTGWYCPLCEKAMVLVRKYTSSDGHCGVETGEWVCAAPTCSLHKEENYEGYGIF